MRQVRLQSSSQVLTFDIWVFFTIEINLALPARAEENKLNVNGMLWSLCTSVLFDFILYPSFIPLHSIVNKFLFHKIVFLAAVSSRCSRLMPRSAPSPSSSSEKYVSRAEYDELKMRFDHLENTVHRFIAANSGIISETSSFGSATSPHLSSESGSVGAPAALGSAQHVTGTPLAGPDYPVPSTGFGIAGTIGNVPATRSPSPSSQNIATTSRFNLPTHHSSASSHSMSSRKFSIPQQPNTTSTYEFESATHHQQVQQGLLGMLPWF